MCSHDYCLLYSRHYRMYFEFCTLGGSAPQSFRANLTLFRTLTLKVCEHFPQKQIFPCKILAHHMKCHLSKNCNFVSERFYIGCIFNKITSEILGSHSSEYEAHSLQGYKVIFNKISLLLFKLLSMIFICYIALKCSVHKCSAHSG
jgi:hypothetical protein